MVPHRPIGKATQNKDDYHAYCTIGRHAIKAKHMYSMKRHRLLEKYIALEIEDKSYQKKMIDPEKHEKIFKIRETHWRLSKPKNQKMNE